MIQSLHLRNFRNFSEIQLDITKGLNFIIASNGSGKTNILEGCAFPADPLIESKAEILLQKDADFFFAEIHTDTASYWYSYSRADHKKKYILNGKATLKAKLKESFPHVIHFHPLEMNIMYLWPSERRNFLDTILVNTFPEYKRLLLGYKKVITSRNKILKRIRDWLSEKWELDFWNQKYITWSLEIYKYRDILTEYITANNWLLKSAFFWKVWKLEFRYISGFDKTDRETHISKYISENKDKEIMLAKTLRWPHLDDFTILLDDFPLIQYASRGEVKSVILWLKQLEVDFIKANNQKQEIIFLIDDLLSELDIEHTAFILDSILPHQALISCIHEPEYSGNKIYL